jgi:hypothetical protein
MLLPDERRSPVARYGTRRPAPVSRRGPSSNSNSLDLIERDLIACSIVELCRARAFMRHASIRFIGFSVSVPAAC